MRCRIVPMHGTSSTANGIQHWRRPPCCAGVNHTLGKNISACVMLTYPVELLHEPELVVAALFFLLAAEVA